MDHSIRLQLVGVYVQSANSAVCTLYSGIIHLAGLQQLINYNRLLNKLIT